MSLINDALKKANQTQKKRAPSGPLGAPIQPVEALKRPPSHLPKVVGALLALVVGGVSVWAFMAWKSKDNFNLAMVDTAGAQPAAVETRPIASKAAVDTASAMAPVETASMPAEELAANHVPSQTAAVRAKIDAGGAAATTETTQPPGVQRTDMAALQMPQPLTTPMTDAASVSSGASTVARPSATLQLTPPSGARPSAPTPSVAPATSAKAAPRTVPSPSPTTSSPAVAKAPTVAAASSTPGANTAEVETKFPNLELQGIFFRLKNPSVMINRRALFVGDKISGVRIVDIQRRTVTIEKDGQRKALSMSGF